MELRLSEMVLPLRLRLERPMTDEELLHFCAENDFWRIEREPNGELSVMTPAGGNTSSRNVYISYVLVEWTEKDGRGIAFDCNGGFLLKDGSMRSPDGAWVNVERWNALSEKQRDQFVPLCPEFVMELRSPSDTLPALREKMAQWIANGTLMEWLIDPKRKIVEIYRAGREVEVVEGISSVWGDGPVEGFELPLDRIWR